VSLILLAGGILLDFFVILSGAIQGGIENKVYFLQAKTNGINGNNVPNPARWTYFALCGEKNGHNAMCGKVRAALPFNPIGNENFGTKQGVPMDFVMNPNTYYYLSRVMWAFYLIALFFAVCALFLSVLALCTRLGAYLAGATTFTAAMSQAVAASLMTFVILYRSLEMLKLTMRHRAWTILARNAFKQNSQQAQLGVYAYGFTWGSFACYLIAMVLFCVGGAAGKSSSEGSSGGMFKRNKSTKSTRSQKSARGSFYDSEAGERRGVKDEYE